MCLYKNMMAFFRIKNNAYGCNIMKNIINRRKGTEKLKNKQEG